MSVTLTDEQRKEIIRLLLIGAQAQPIIQDRVHQALAVLGAYK